MKVPLPGIRKTCGCMKYIRKILQLQHVSCLDLVEAHRLDTSVTEKQSWRILKWTLTLLHSGRRLFPWRIPAFLLAMNWTLLSLRRWRFWRRKSAEDGFKNCQLRRLAHRKKERKKKKKKAKSLVTQDRLSFSLWPCPQKLTLLSPLNSILTRSRNL